VDPIPDPLLLRKSGSAGNETRTSGSVAMHSDQQTTAVVTVIEHFREFPQIFQTKAQSNLQQMTVLRSTSSSIQHLSYHHPNFRQYLTCEVG
jgi:hypothetical protein